MNCSDNTRYSATSGSAEIVSPANNAPMLTACSPKNTDRPCGTVLRLALEMKTIGNRKSFQIGMAV